MSSVDDATQTMIQNLLEKTGKSLDEWASLVRAMGIEKHGEILTFLQEKHNLTYGYAHLIALTARSSGVAAFSGDELLEAQFSGAKSALRPIYESIIEAVSAFGDDVEIAPKKAYVSIRRRKQFAIIQPTTATRLDVGINLKDAEAAGRLEASGSFNSMVSHRVRVASLDAVDESLIDWLRQAYDAA